MKAIELVERLALYVLAFITAVLVLDGVLTFFDAREENAVVAFVSGLADRFTPDAMTTMFVEQTDLQTTAIALLAYGLLAGLVVVVARWLRSAVLSVGKVRAQRGAEEGA